jgi:hypothetical protein
MWNCWNYRRKHSRHFDFRGIRCTFGIAGKVVELAREARVSLPEKRRQLPTNFAGQRCPGGCATGASPGQSLIAKKLAQRDSAPTTAVSKRTSNCRVRAV